MKAAIRYYSRSGHTKAIAEAIAKPLGVPAVSIEAQPPDLSGPVDVLFIGGSLYAYGIDKKLENYIQKLPSQEVKKAVVFSTSWVSKHAVDLIKQALRDKGIQVEKQYFYVRGKPKESDLRDADVFASRYLIAP